MLKKTVRMAAVPAVALSLVLAMSTIVSAQQTGTITGTVTDASGQVLQGAQVHIPARQLGTLTNEQGRFILLNVPAGEHTVRSQMLGYASQEQTVTVGAGATVVATDPVPSAPRARSWARPSATWNRTTTAPRARTPWPCSPSGASTGNRIFRA